MARQATLTVCSSIQIDREHASPTWVAKWRYRVRQLLQVAPGVLKGRTSVGFCPVCERRTLFQQHGPWHREGLRCVRCASIPRWRALVHVLEEHFPNWRDLAIHESSPGGAGSEKLARECRRYTASWYLPDVPRGESRAGRRCEDLQAQTFADGTFDLVITQDVFEHLPDPAQGFREVDRTLKPGGSHVFTVPWHAGKATERRAVLRNGKLELLKEAEYHGDPVNPKGALVFTEWGADMADFIHRHCGMTTTALRIDDRRQGLDGKFTEVFISRKARGAGVG